MRKTLILFWHGLGDNILATPAIKSFKEVTGDFVGWAMLRRFRKSRLMDFCPYIDRLHWVSDAWNDHGDYANGKRAVRQEAESICKDSGYHRLIVVDHQSSNRHKILRTADELGVSLDEKRINTQVWFPSDLAKKRVSELNLPARFAFFHGKTGVPEKDLPLAEVKTWISRKGIELPLISPDFSWDITSEPIFVSFEVMRSAAIICVADSVMYHAAHAMQLNVDFAYFQKGKAVWNVVRPLHKAKEMVAFSLTCNHVNIGMRTGRLG